MFIEIASAVLLVSQFAYHRYKDLTRKWEGQTAREIEIPSIKEGSTYPLVYGRCRVQQPVLAWAGPPYHGASNGGVPDLYCVNMLFLAGVPFRNGTNRLHTIYQGDLKLVRSDTGSGSAGSLACDLDELTGEGANEFDTRVAVVWNPGDMFDNVGAFVGGRVEFLNGKTDQLLIGPSPSFDLLTKAAQYMTPEVPETDVPGYRHRLGVFLYNQVGAGWSLGFASALPSMQFEMSSYPAELRLALSANVGLEANPADVILDLLVGELKLGIPMAFINYPSFVTAAAQLLAEGHGFSRAFEGGPAEELIDEILRQIDAVLYVDPATSKWTLKLIRPVDPSTVPHLTPADAVVSNWRLRGFTEVPNKVRVIYRNRQEHYREDSATAHNQANAVGQLGEVDELQLNFPGVCTEELAQTIAERELSFVSQPLAACRISTSRAYASLVPGNVVSLTWPEFGVSRMLFRIAAVDRGTLEDGFVHLDVIQDRAREYRGGFDSIDVPGVPAHRG